MQLTHLLGTKQVLLDHSIGYVADDVLISGTGTDILDGNLGNDTYIIDKNPDKVTTIRDIGGEKTSIILRNTGITKLDKITVDGNGYLSLGNKQYLDLNIATDAKNVEIFIYNNNKLKSLGTLDKLGAEKVSKIYKDDFCSQFSDAGLNVVFLEGVGTLEVGSPNLTTIDTITNDVERTSDMEDACDSTTTVTEYSWGIAYIDTSIINPSIYIVIDNQYIDNGSTVMINANEKCDLAIGVIDDKNTFLGCDRKYSIKFKNYDVRFDYVSTHGTAQGEVDWIDTIVGGINLFEELFGK